MTDDRLRGDELGLGLSPQELAVLREYVRTGSLKETADNLDLRWDTVRKYVKRIHRKLGTHSMIEVYGRLGWVVVP